MNNCVHVSIGGPKYVQWRGRIVLQLDQALGVSKYEYSFSFPETFQRALHCNDKLLFLGIPIPLHFHHRHVSELLFPYQI